MKTKHLFLCLAIGVSFCGIANAQSSHYETILRERNITADADGLNEYLRELHPNEAQRQRAAALIVQLGSGDSFAAREDAMAKLLVMPVLPNEALIAASNGPDPEICWRAKRILKLGKPESERVLFAAFKTIEEKKIAGVAAEVLRSILLCDKAHLRYAARRALVAATRSKDSGAIKRGLKDESAEVRVSAAAASGKALGENAVAHLLPLLNDRSQTVQLAAARAAANLRYRDTLPVFARLLSSDEIAIRVSASAALRDLSGKHFGFAAYDKVDKRKTAIDKWKAWVAGDGKTAKLIVPLKSSGSGGGHLGGNTLLAFGYKNKVVEYDPSGKEVWSHTIKGAWSAEKLANGNVLVAAYSESRVVEVDPNGNVTWEYRASQPLNARPLANGNVLISVHQGRKVVEVDRDKRIVWEMATPAGYCCDAHRLDNGNTLYAAGKVVAEVTPDKKEIWKFNTSGQAYGIHPRANGNVLICELNGRVIEVDRDANVVWETTEQNPVDAFPLPNGNILITGGQRFIEITPDKKIVWSKTGCNYGTARR